MAFFPDHESNTCPSAKPESVTKAVDRVNMGLVQLYRYTLSKPGGVARLAGFFLTDVE